MEVKVSVDQPIQGRIGQFNGWEDPCQSINQRGQLTLKRRIARLSSSFLRIICNTTALDSVNKSI